MIQRSLLHQIRSTPRITGCLRAKTLPTRPYTPLSSTISAQRAALRCYSSAAETAGKANPDTSHTEQSPEEAKDEADPRKKELEAKEREVVELKDKYLRSVADFRNLQERSKRDMQGAKDFALTRFAKDLVESVDNFDRALETVPPEKREDGSNPDLVNLYSGLKMTESILMQTLKKHGLERFDPSENQEKFDPNLHEATFQTPVEGKENGTAFLTSQKGFLLNGRVIRAAKVGVVKNP